MSSVPRWERSLGGGHGNPIQYSCLENPMDRGTWWATVHRVAQNRTQLKQLYILGRYYWHIVSSSSLLTSFFFLGGSCNFSFFISNFIHLSLYAFSWGV